MKRLTHYLLAFAAAWTLFSATPAFALVSFPKATVNNASGTYTPNALINAWFEYNLTGDVTIQPPTNTTNGQFVIFTFHDDATHVVTWAEEYAGVPEQVGYWGGWQGLFLVDGGTIRIIYGTPF